MVCQIFTIMKKLIKVKREETKEIDVVYPLYVRQNDLFCYMIIDNDRYIEVTDSSWTKNISLMNTSVPDEYFLCERITKQEFLDKYKEVELEINKNTIDI